MYYLHCLKCESTKSWNLCKTSFEALLCSGLIVVVRPRSPEQLYAAHPHFKSAEPHICCPRAVLQHLTRERFQHTSCIEPVMKMLYDWGWRSGNYINVSIELLERQEDKHWFLIVDKEVARARGILLWMYLCGDYIWTYLIINIPDPQNNQRRVRLRMLLIEFVFSGAWHYCDGGDLGAMVYVGYHQILYLPPQHTQYTSQPGVQDTKHKNNSDKCWPQHQKAHHHHLLLIFW